jgi:hypothetical protein
MRPFGSWGTRYVDGSIQLGARVEVHVVLAATGDFNPPKEWVKGYTLQGIIDGVGVVRHEGGWNAGCLVNYDMEDIRLENDRSKEAQGRRSKV